MTITLQNNDNDIISLPILSSYKTSSRGSTSQEYSNSTSSPSEFVVYSARHGAAVVVSCCNELEFLDLETQLLSSNAPTHHLPLCTKEEDDLCCPQEEDSFDNFYYGKETDDDSSSISSYSCISADEKKVTFADTLVSNVWTRPRTPVEDCKTLFYTYEETQRFRQDYRRERRLLQQANTVDPTVRNKEEERLNESNSRGRHSISRVVVLHNNTLETFYDDQYKLSTIVNYQATPDDKPTDDFFDNDSFWSGSITWF